MPGKVLENGTCLASALCGWWSEQIAEIFSVEIAFLSEIKSSSGYYLDLGYNVGSLYCSGITFTA